MKRYIPIAVCLLATSIAHAEDEVHWGYSGAEGPENWASLSPEFSACTGRNQSPIDLTGFVEAELQPIKFSYESASEKILNNGHTVQVNYAAGSRIEIAGRVFELLQFHFHAPSENHINGRPYPLEAHLVHADEQGDLAVVAVMFEEGETNETLAAAWQKMPDAGDTRPLDSFSVDGILPEDRDYYRFNGSLTIPPCTEGVMWLVMKQTVTASAEQIKQFLNGIGGPNSRPLQPIHARPILR